MLTQNKRLFRFDSCLTLQNSFFFSFDIVFLLYRFRFFSLYVVFLLYRFRRFFSLDFVFLLYRFHFISLDFVFLLYRFRFISLDSFSYFTDFVSFRWIRFLTLQISLDFVFVSFLFVSQFTGTHFIHIGACFFTWGKARGVPDEVVVNSTTIRPRRLKFS